MLIKEKLCLSIFLVIILQTFHPSTQAISEQTSQQIVFSQQRSQPIRIHTQYSFTDELTDGAQLLLKDIVNSTVLRISSILSVYTVPGPLLLRRIGSCLLKWASGPNIGKCKSIRSVKETCLDEFQIPDEHLEGLLVWSSYNNTVPDVIKQPGSGLPDTDFILYITAISTWKCLEEGSNILAYASYCQVDDNSRPLAGQVNFCPALLYDANFSRQRAHLIALHEIFHALGFTKSLFNEFRDCTEIDPGQPCPIRHKPIRNIQGSPRLATPKVEELILAHLNCTKDNQHDDFGVILQHQDDDVNSHWNLTFMYSSLMTSEVGLAKTTILDSITLAVFEDSGWYSEVDYSKAEPFFWGKDAGCSFPLDDSGKCHPNFFCSERLFGCHHLHRYRGQCTDDVCGVYKADRSGDCWSDNTPSVVSMMGVPEVFGLSSQCFANNLTKSYETASWIGQCLSHSCRGDTPFVEIDGQMVQCPPGTVIEVAGYQGILECPLKGILCSKENSHENSGSTVSTPKSMPVSTAPTVIPKESLTVELICSEKTRPNLDDQEDIHNYLQIIEVCILNITNIDIHRVHNLTVDQESNRTKFTISSQTSASGISIFDAYNLLEQHVVEGKFEFSFKDQPVKIIMIRCSCHDQENLEPTGDTPTLSKIHQFAIAITIILIVLILGITAIVLLKHKAIALLFKHNNQEHINMGHPQI